MLGGLCFPVAQFRGFQERCMGREGTECLPVLIILLACGKYGHVMGGVLLPVVHRVSSLATGFRKPHSRNPGNFCSTTFRHLSYM